MPEPFAHRLRDADQPLILGRHIAQPLTEDGRGCVCRRHSWAGTSSGLTLGHAVITDRIFFRRLIAFALLGHHMQQLGTLELAHSRNRPSRIIPHVSQESLVKNFPTLKHARFWMTFGQEYLTHLRVIQNIGMSRIDPIDYNGQQIVPIQFLKVNSSVLMKYNALKILVNKILK